jgi:cell division protein FtsN
VLLDTLPVAILDEDKTLENFIDLNEYFYDQDGDVLTYEYEDSENIEIKLGYKEDFVYVSIDPKKNYYGTEEIIFQATDIPGSSPINATLQVTVNPVNDVPILNASYEWNVISSSSYIVGTTITVMEDSVAEIYVTAYDPADHDTLTFSDDTELFNIEPQTGKILFTPTNDDVGEHDVEITVDDGQTVDNSVSEVFKFVVQNTNDPPETPQIISPVDGNTYITDTLIEFKGTAEDPDLNIVDSDDWLSYEWTTNKSSDSLSFDIEFLTKLDPGYYTIKFTVNDKAHEQRSTEISIIVDIDRTLDTDSDGTPDYQDDDDDGDGIPDVWELKYSLYLDPLDGSDAKDDSDRDGFTNLEEYLGNDGEPGGDDSSDPTRKNSKPEQKAAPGGSTTESSSTYLIAAILGVVIVVVLLLLLFLVIIPKRKKKSEQPQQPQPMPTVAPPGQPPQPDTQVPPPPMPMLDMDMSMTPEQYQQMMQQMMEMQMQQMQQQGQSPQQQPAQYGTETQQYDPSQPQPQQMDQYQSPAPESTLPPPPTEGSQPLLEPAADPTTGEVASTPTPEQPTQPTPEIGGQTPTQSNMNCQHCGQPTTEGWIICPNCKQVL